MGNSRSRNSNTFGNMHRGLAALTFPWLIFELVSGGVVKYSHVTLVHNSWISVWCRIVHMWTSYGCIIANNIITLSGIYAYGSSTTTLLYYNWGVLIILTIALELISRCSSKWRYKNIYQLQKWDLPEVSMDKFLESVRNGSKWALFDDYIVDMDKYIWEHPGGSYVLNECIGGDLGKYFYGSYSMENWIKPVTHSRVAGRILFKLICAKLKHSPSIYQVFTPIDQQNPINGKGTTFMFTVKRKTELNKDIWRVVFENKQLSIKKFYKGLDLAGRGFIISSPRNQVSRYYTICNCMVEKIYEEYRSAFLSCIDHKPYSRKYCSVEDYFNDEDNCLELVIKFYKQTRTGISKQISKAKPNKQFYIDGPQGKGFNFSRNNTSGTHVIFMGGTGVLPFMDLFAYLGRKILKENSPDYAIFPDEEFKDINPNAKWIVYAFFPSRDRSVCLEFIELIELLYQNFNRAKFFKFVPVFTREGGFRLNEDKIDEILTKIHTRSQINKIFVCGPPPQNNLFQKCMKRISDKLGLYRDSYEIL